MTIDEAEKLRAIRDQLKLKTVSLTPLSKALLDSAEFNLDRVLVAEPIAIPTPMLSEQRGVLEAAARALDV